MHCRFCSTPLEIKVLDLGFQPPSNSYLSLTDLSKAERYYPLRLRVCDSCWLVQTEDYAHETEFFSPDYAYFSSTSTSWLKHAEDYVEMISTRLNLNKQSFVVEIASNDGYLLKNFVAKKIPCLGVEPTSSTADASESIGVPVLRKFFGTNTAISMVEANKKADLIIGNNVYAHVPDINDFTKGISMLLTDEGTVTLEFPHLMRLVEFNQFDTVYHEHFSYLSLSTVTQIFEKNGLRVYDVEEISTHGGSIRVYGCKTNATHKTSLKVASLLTEEEKRGMLSIEYYKNFQKQFDLIKNNLLSFLLEASTNNKIVAAYGAAAKGNTLLNYAGVKPDLVHFVCDAAKAKQNKFLPGSHIPIYHPDKLKEIVPDYILVLPWNIYTEVSQQNQFLKEKGARFVKAIPQLHIE
ncbi:MAG: class I SAM-dependent methyltransferase [Bacteroidia bacterium]|nr:class I SAM-dependent methyltransferase [Bacteroidia bacterium]